MKETQNSINDGYAGLIKPEEKENKEVEERVALEDNNSMSKREGLLT